MPTEQRKSRRSSKDQNIKKLAGYLEFSSWLITIFGMMSQGVFSGRSFWLSRKQRNLFLFFKVTASYAFPSYNIALGFWGAYCSFSKHGRATFGFKNINHIFFIIVNPSSPFLVILGLFRCRLSP